MLPFWNLEIDLPIIVALLLSALAVSGPSLALVLTGRSMLPDVLSHGSLPGLVLVVSWLSVSILASWLGALLAGVACLWFIRWLRTGSSLPLSAAMVATLSGFFALGAFIQALLFGRAAHFDVEHFLFGSLELLVWPGLRHMGMADLFGDMPLEIASLALSALGTVAGMVVLARPLSVVVFDSVGARLQGLPVTILEALMMIWTIVVITTVLQSLGLALTVALCVCPATCARLLSSRLSHLGGLTILVALLGGSIGYGLSLFLPHWLGLSRGWSVSGTIAVVLMLITLGVAVWSARVFRPAGRVPRGNEAAAQGVTSA